MLRKFCILLVLLLPPLLVFSEVRNAGFVRWDDLNNIPFNLHLSQPVPQALGHFWTQPFRELYIPLTYTAWTFVATISRQDQPIKTLGGDPLLYSAIPFHLLNLAVHLLNTFLAFLLLKRLTKSTWGALGGALVFSLHPLQVEPVAWVTGFKDLGGTFWSLCTLLTFDRFLELTTAARSTQPDTPQASRGKAWWGISLVAFSAALLSKPAAVTVPLVLLALGIWQHRRPLRPALIAIAPHLVLAAVVVLVTRSVQDTTSGLTPLSPWQRLQIAGDALAFYAAKIAAPIGLGIDYGRTPATVLAQSTSLIAPLSLVFAGILVWWTSRRAPKLAVALTLFLAGVLPVLGLVPFTFQTYSTVADRYVYAALLGLALLVAATLAHIESKHHSLLRIAGIATGAICLVLASLSSIQTLTWTNDLSLFRNGIQVNPRSWASHLNLGLSLRAEGQMEAAEQACRTALEINPGSDLAHNALGNLLASRGAVSEAIEHYQAAIAANPQMAEAYYHLGLAQERSGDKMSAATMYAKALQIKPELALAQRALERLR